MKREDLYLIKIIIVWFVFLIFYKNFLKLENETEIFRMKKYNSLNFSLIPVEEKNEDNVVFHHSHSEILKYPPNLKKYPLIKNDVISLLNLFKEITESNGYRILLATINSNMCRKFHTDINDLRMLCTYKGPGTLWLTENNINRKALESRCENNNIALDENKIKQAETGSVVLLKGALYPKEGTNAIVHRSPTIEESGKKRLLLRIDTNEFLNFLQ